MSGWRAATSWFPGHMAQASRDMSQRLAKVDLVLEVRDARAPFSSASSQLHRLLQARRAPRLLVLNKADLLGEAQRRAMRRRLEEEEPGVRLFFAAAAERRGVAPILAAAVEQVRRESPRLFGRRQGARGGPAGATASMFAQELMVQAAAEAMPQGAEALPLMMMVAGAPNTGKSTLINAMRQEGARDAPGVVRRMAPAKMGKLPGVTRQLSSFQVSWEPPVWMLDTPGVLPPNIDNGWEGAMRLGVLDMIRTDAEHREALCSYLLHHLATHHIEVLSRWPRAHRLALRSAQGVLMMDGELRDIEQQVRSRLLGLEPSEAEVKLQVAETIGVWLLESVAQDMQQFCLGVRNGAGVREKKLNLHSTAMLLLKMMREGRLGEVCLDDHPFLVPPISKEERIRRKLQKKVERRRKLGKHLLI
ncbi:hypothetical protein AB1Y20_007784 [Prymnesium parvum]|uniref:G domain-containing protein n=1 Tax=Prymnesium parvum TaxID=97485 RepID=A0AB34ISV0_PRYPA